ncbi:MAG: hypothetical protein ACE5RC_00025 [Nitrosopumilus sp.]
MTNLKVNKYLKIDLFGKGEWLDEPDQLEFTYNEFNCYIKRPFSGNLCGYVEIPEDNIFYNRECFKCYELYEKVSVHGGITFSDFIFDEERQKKIFFVGFDCAHLGDYVPLVEKYKIQNLNHKKFRNEIFKNVTKKLEKLEKLEKDILNGEKTYKNIEFVTQELESLVDQIIKIDSDEEKK